MSKIVLDAATVEAIVAAGQGAELYDPEGKPIGCVQLYPPDLIEALVRRSKEKPPPGYSSFKDYCAAMWSRFDPDLLSKISDSDRWATHDEVMKLVEVAQCTK